MGPYFQSIGVFRDGEPVPATFEEFDNVKEEDGIDLREEEDVLNT